jgi:protein-S-isoprenylcysteine O-methyltransferase Ste14
MISLLLRNLLFTIIQPGVVAGAIPYLLVQKNGHEGFTLPVSWNEYLGLCIGIGGAAVVFYCIYLFATEGRGTLSPADPTHNLVAKGLYRYSRNPMYIGVLMILAGEALYTSYAVLWLYTGIIFLLFHLFVVFFEEPRLKKDFGETYSSYSKQVRRWI